MCCQVTNPPVGCFVLLEVNVIVGEIKKFFTVFLNTKYDQLSYSLVAELYKLFSLKCVVI